MALGIVDLRERPYHADAVAERIWNAFWRHRGTPIATIREGLATILKNQDGVPFALVVESDGRVCCNTLVIDNDETTKPELTPLIAAVWVDEDLRGLGWRALEYDVGRHRQVPYARDLGAVFPLF